METTHAGGVAVKAPGCPLCGHKRLRSLTTPHRWIGEQVFGPYREQFGVQKCRGCAFVFVNPRPSDALLAAFYGGFDYGCHHPEQTDSGGNPAAEHVLDVIHANLSSAAAAAPRFLDFGCGAGVTLKAALRRGWDACGYDVGQAAVENCRRQGFRASDKLSELPAQGFDAILLNHVFEHIADPRGTLRELARLLAPGGKVFIQSPNVESLRARMSLPPLSRRLNFDERFRAFPIHLSYFSPRTLARLLRSTGYVVDRTMTFGVGLDELIFEDGREVERPTGSAPPTNGNGHAHAGGGGGPLAPVKQIAKKLTKTAIFGTGLGENVMVVASLPG